MTPKEILDHLDKRFKLLSAGRRTAVSRHQTLRSTLDWSYDLLEGPEQLAFARLSAFTGDFDLVSAEAVLEDDLLEPFEIADLLFRLVEKSLVVAQAGTDVTRYRLLETVREYAWERLVANDESASVASRHCHHFLTVAEELGPLLCGPNEVDARTRIERDLDNLRASLRWAIDDGDAATALRLVDALAVMGSLRSPYGTLPIEVAQMEGAAEDPLAAVAMSAAAAALSSQGEHTRAAALGEKSLEIASAVQDLQVGNYVKCRVFANLGMVQFLQTDFSRFLGIARQWLDAARQLGDPFEISQALNLVGSLDPDPAEALSACESALELAREIGNPSRIAYCSIVLGSRLSVIDVDRAEVVFSEARSAARAAENDWVDQFAAMQLALQQVRRGDLVGSAETLIEIATRFIWKGDNFSIAQNFTILTFVLASMGHDEVALLLAAWVEAHVLPVDTMHPFFEGLTDAFVALLAHQSDKDRAEMGRRAEGLDVRQVTEIAQAHIETLQGASD